MIEFKRKYYEMIMDLVLMEDVCGIANFIVNNKDLPDDLAERLVLGILNKPCSETPDEYEMAMRKNIAIKIINACPNISRDIQDELMRYGQLKKDGLRLVRTMKSSEEYRKDETC